MLFLLVVYAGILLRENDTHVIREHDVPRLSRVKSASVLRDSKRKRLESIEHSRKSGCRVSLQEHNG